MKKVSLGILAHVDAGKTTLNESILFHAGVIRSRGNVDDRDTYMDYDSQEKERGITIYSKTAQILWKNTSFTLIDTPGHTDFSAEMERALSVVDMAVLLINGQDGVQNHTRTIWDLLKYYQIPTFLFINKTDISAYDSSWLLNNVQKELSEDCVDYFNLTEMEEKTALSDESLLESYLEGKPMEEKDFRMAFLKRKIFPVFFGSALKDTGVVELLDALDRFSEEKTYPQDLGLKIYKISYDDAGMRYVWAKLTGGSIKAKEKLNETDRIDQIFMVSGKKFNNVPSAEAGDIVAIKGLEGHLAGEGIGSEHCSLDTVLSAYMNYRVILPKGCDTNKMMQQLVMISEEDPQIRVSFEEESREIHLQLMGEIQIDVIKNIIFKRTGVEVNFDNGRIIYKETITNIVRGVGHFEPLRHYAEVHLRLEPLPEGSGLVFASEVSTDALAINWQRLVLTHLKEKTHRGVLTGSPITDMKITLIAGRAHLKHTEGGDFREATYRAVRHGLKKADSVLLEPYYRYVIEVKKDYLSRILYDLENMNAEIRIDEENGISIISGIAPVVKMQNYQTTLASLSSGSGRIMTSLYGYKPVKDEIEVLNQFHYDSESDFRNPTGSVFCAHGAGFYVPYNHVEEFMHIKPDEHLISANVNYHNKVRISEEELNRVFSNVNGRNRKEKNHERDKKTELKEQKIEIVEKKKELVLVDGYNVMHYLNKTRDLIENNLELTRDVLINELGNYAGYRNCDLVVVFDAYRVSDGLGSVNKVSNITAVYTRGGQTADAYLEKAVHDYAKDYDITVVTSDYAVQNMILGSGAKRMSSRELEIELEYYRSSH